MNKSLLYLFCFFFTGSAFAQVDCNLNYYDKTNSNDPYIYSYDPLTNTHSNTGITLPPLSVGLAINNNLNGGSPSPTFYTVSGSTYHYWNGSGWVDTGHTSGVGVVGNLGGAGPYIYSINGSTGQVWQYNGTGNAVLLTTLPGYVGPYDIAGDIQGNFYVLFNAIGNQHLAVYNPQGVQISSYTLSGLPSLSGGPGLSVVNGFIYVGLNLSSYVGTFNGNTITFAPITYYYAGDYASCPFTPFLTAITASDSVLDLCAGDTVTLTATTDITNPVYTWSGPGILFGQGTGSILVNQAGTFSLTVTSATAGNNSSTTTSYALAADASFPTITPQGPFCADQPAVQLVASDSSGTWSASCGSCITSSGSFSPTLAGAGTDTIYFLASGCITPASTTILVYPLPTVSAGSDLAVCPGTSITLSGSGTASYSWDQGVTNGTAFVPTTGSTYTVTGTDTNGCTNTSQVVVTLYTPPTVDAGPDQSICTGTSTVLTGSGAETYSWDNNIYDGTAFTPAVGALTYNVTGTDTNSCTNTDQVVITVHDLPVIDAGADQTGCETDYFVLAGSGAGTTGTYSWTGGITNGMGFQSPTGSTSYTVTGTDGFGCMNTDQVLITTDKVPELQISWQQEQVCPASEVTFWNNTADNLVSCTWQTGDGTSIQSCEQQLSYSYTTPGLYTLSFYAGTPLGCQVDTSFPSAIYVSEPPLAAFEFKTSALTIINPGVQVTNESSGAVSYTWTALEVDSLSGFEPEFEFPPSPGIYTVQLIATNADGCTDTAVRSIQVLDELVYYIPNTFTPNGDERNQTFCPVFTSGYDPFDFTLKIYNRWGEVLFESHDATAGWDGSYGGKMCQDGVYTWSIEFKRSDSDKREHVEGHLNLIR